MILFKKALIGILLGSAIGATTVCMDGNAYKYGLTVSPGKHRQWHNLGSLKTCIKAVGGEVTYSDERTTLCALLPDQANVGNGFMGHVLEAVLLK